MNRSVIARLALSALAVLAGSGVAVSTAAAAPSPPSAQVYPGTVTRPILSAAEAAPLTQRAYLAGSGSNSAPVADPWSPAPIRTAGIHPDFVVGAPSRSHPATYSTVQTAVNAAIQLGGTGRIYIKLLPGTYTGTVYVPAASPPITLYGAGSAPGDVAIELTLDAVSSPATYSALVNPAGQYADGDPAWAMYTSCAGKTTATVGTGCAAVLWSQSVDFQLKNLTVRNTLLDTVDSGSHQAVAVRTDGDRTQLESVRLISRQDTAYFNTPDVTTISRVFARDSYFEGDTDFVFGRATAVFEHCQFTVVSSRKPANGVVFSPSTTPTWSYGFLVTNSRISTDAGYAAAPTAHLGRAWDAGAGTTGYLLGSSPNGQLLIKNSYLGTGFDVVAPWAPAATTSRPFSASIQPDRNLDNPAYNRLWEFGNFGPAAGTSTSSGSETGS
jgi:pectinesterase